MENVQDLVENLRAKDNQIAYTSLKALTAISANSDAVYPYFDCFIEMLGDASSYVRARGIVLIAANVQWDADHKTEAVISEYLRHIADERPITARQCIQALPVIVRHKPHLSDSICAALQGAEPHMYSSSMQPLIREDIREALRTIHENKEASS